MASLESFKSLNHPSDQDTSFFVYVFFLSGKSGLADHPPPFSGQFHYFMFFLTLLLEQCQTKCIMLRFIEMSIDWNIIVFMFLDGE